MNGLIFFYLLMVVAVVGCLLARHYIATILNLPRLSWCVWALPFIALFILTACTPQTGQAQAPPTFTSEYASRTKVLIDNTTGCQYLVLHGFNGAVAVTPRIEKSASMYSEFTVRGCR